MYIEWNLKESVEFWKRLFCIIQKKKRHLMNRLFEQRDYFKYKLHEGG
jgi:hypothetical protein